MTKQVRIENADTSSYKLRVYIERKTEAGEWVRDPNDAPVHLEYPCMMHAGWVHQSQRLVVEEA